MIGFFPPNESVTTGLPHGVQPVPIYSSDKDSELMLYAYKSCPESVIRSCRRQNDTSTSRLKSVRLKRQQKLLLEHPDYTELELKHDSLLTNLSALFGKKLRLKDIASIVNLVQAERVRNDFIDFSKDIKLIIIDTRKNRDRRCDLIIMGGNETHLSVGGMYINATFVQFLIRGILINIYSTGENITHTIWLEWESVDYLTR